MLLTGEVNLTYITQMTGLEGQCLILPDDTAIFVTDGRYTEAAEQKLIPRGFAVLTRSNMSAMYDYLRSVLEQHDIRKLMYEDDVLTVSDFALMREQLQLSFQPVGDRIRKLRACKSAEEVDCIVRAQRIAEAALERLLPKLHTGITEREAAAMLNYYMALGGSEKPSFDTILLFGEPFEKADLPVQSAAPVFSEVLKVFIVTFVEAGPFSLSRLSLLISFFSRPLNHHAPSMYCPTGASSVMFGLPFSSLNVILTSSTVFVAGMNLAICQSRRSRMLLKGTFS